jgi:hypothetical protein
MLLIPTDCWSTGLWFHQRVTWRTGRDPRAWETSVASPDGKERYRLALIPLWAVEGGIVAVEILLARPEHPDDNLLGQRETDVPKPFEVTLEELERGIDKSRFGANREFNVDRLRLRVKIEGARLGKGVGDCKDCSNIQELTVLFTLARK